MILNLEAINAFNSCSGINYSSSAFAPSPKVMIAGSPVKADIFKKYVADPLF